jgi:hypothetical protein
LGAGQGHPRRVRTHIHVSHSFMENTKVTEVVGEVLLSRVILVGLQELL